MTLIGQDTLSLAGRKHAPLRKWLATWIRTVENADWPNLDELRKTYPSADGVKLSSNTIVTVFNVKGRDYRLLTWIDYESQVVEALDVLTHAEYSKGKWKERY